jgi:Obg family GTPase CgtA-like protein
MNLQIPPLPWRELSSPKRVDPETMEVSGSRIERLAATVDMEADEAVAWFQEQLEEQGVLKALRDAGVEEGDTWSSARWSSSTRPRCGSRSSAGNEARVADRGAHLVLWDATAGRAD